MTAIHSLLPVAICNRCGRSSRHRCDVAERCDARFGGRRCDGEYVRLPYITTGTQRAVPGSNGDAAYH